MVADKEYERERLDGLARGAAHFPHPSCSATLRGSLVPPQQCLSWHPCLRSGVPESACLSSQNQVDCYPPAGTLCSDPAMALCHHTTHPRLPRLEDGSHMESSDTHRVRAQHPVVYLS